MARNHQGVHVIKITSGHTAEDFENWVVYNYPPLWIVERSGNYAVVTTFKDTVTGQNGMKVLGQFDENTPGNDLGITIQMASQAEGADEFSGGDKSAFNTKMKNWREQFLLS
jgi:hypothetical protein